MLVGAGLHPLEHVPGEGLAGVVTSSEVQQGIVDIPGATIGLIQGEQDRYIIRGYRPDPAANDLVPNKDGIPVPFSSLTNAERRDLGYSYTVDAPPAAAVPPPGSTGIIQAPSLEHNVIYPALSALDAVAVVGVVPAAVKAGKSPSAPPPGGPPGSGEYVRTQPGQPPQRVFSHFDSVTGEPVYTVGSPPPSSSTESPGSSSTVYTYIDQDGNRLYLTEAPPPGPPTTGGDYYPGFLDEGNPPPWGGDAPDPPPPGPESGGSYETPGGSHVDTYTTQDGKTIYTVEYPEVDESSQPVNVSGDGSVLGATSDADAAVVVADPEAPTVVEPEVERRSKSRRSSRLRSRIRRYGFRKTTPQLPWNRRPETLTIQTETRRVIRNPSLNRCPTQKRIRIPKRATLRPSQTMHQE